MTKYIQNTIIATAFVFVLTLLISNIYFQYDVPNYTGIQSLPIIKDTVEVYTDKYGVPHIFANSDEDLFFTAGYIIARERLFQLTLFASVVRGEVSSILGTSYSDLDNYIQENNMFTANDSVTINYMNSELINYYCRGINAWIDESENELPISFKILNTKPIKWLETDVIAVASMMTGEVVKENNTVLFINSIKQYFGEKRLGELFGYETLEKYNKIINNSFEPYNIDISMENKVWELVGLDNQTREKYSVIIPQENTFLKQPILLFEDFGDFKQPAKWYDIHLNGRNYNFEGSVIPGFPIPISGRTIDKTWAIVGQLDNGAINTIFDVASNGHLKSPAPFLNYTDTSGAIFVSASKSRKDIQMQSQLDLIEEIKVEYLINRASESVNQNTIDIIQKTLKIYTENSPKSNGLIDRLQSSANNTNGLYSELKSINSIYKNLMYAIYYDEFSLVGENVYNIFSQLPEIAEQGIIQVLNNSKSSWIDDISTLDYHENLNDIVLKAVDMSLLEIENNGINYQPNDDPTPFYRHILGENTIIAKLFNLNVGKNKNTNTSVSNSNIRRIFDLSDSSTSYSILSTGQSGLPKSNNYADQMEMYKNNEFRKIEIDKEIIRNSDQYRKLVLCPFE